MNQATVMYNGIPISTATQLGKELVKWERKPGYNPAANPYPKMLYRAVKCKDGSVRAIMDEPNQYDYNKENMALMQRDTDQVRAFNLGNQITARDEDHHAILKGQGWRESMAEAIEAQHQSEYRRQDAVAQRLIDDRNMSEEARAESRTAEVRSDGLMPEVPVSRTAKPVSATVKEHWKTRKAREAREQAGN